MALAAGSGRQSRLGLRDVVTNSSPAFVLSGVRMFAAGPYQSLFLRGDGTVMAAGYSHPDGTGVNGIGPVPGLPDVQAVSMGAYYSLFLKNDGTVLASGYNEYGQLGDGSLEGTSKNKENFSEVIGISSPSGSIVVFSGDPPVIFLQNASNPTWKEGAAHVRRSCPRTIP